MIRLSELTEVAQHLENLAKSEKGQKADVVLQFMDFSQRVDQAMVY